MSDEHPESLHILDHSALSRIREVQAVGGADLLTAMVNAFFTDAPTILARMTDAQARGDADGLADAVHSLKSGAAYLGALGVERLCHELETLGHSETVTASQELIALLPLALAQARLALEAEIIPGPDA